MRTFAALIQQIDLMVCNDTGPMHIGFATETPTIAIFCPTGPYLCEPYNAKTHTIIVKKKICANPFCMLQIEIQEVYEDVLHPRSTRKTIVKGLNIFSVSHCFKNRSVISIRSFPKQGILYILEQAHLMKISPPLSSLKNSILGSCFYEPSTRTRLSFETAMLRLGGQIVGFSDAKNTAAQKGESLEDTIRVIGSFTDIIALRHPSKEAIYLAHKSTKTPVINAGNGIEEHPTQTLTDLFTIKQTHESLEGLSIAFVGDLKYGRTVHSLCLACALFGMRLFFCAPNGLSIPQELLSLLENKQAQFSFHQSLEEIIPHLDILYVTRLQTHKLTNADPQVFTLYPLTLDHLVHAPAHLKILHPLPRNEEIDSSIDHTNFAQYFQQAENGVYIRMALLHAILQGP